MLSISVGTRTVGINSSTMRTVRMMLAWQPVAQERTHEEKPQHQCSLEAIANSRAKLAIATLLVRRLKDRPVRAICESKMSNICPKCRKYL